MPTDLQMSLVTLFEVDDVDICGDAPTAWMRNPETVAALKQVKRRCAGARETA